jgi:aminopeptidase
VKPNQGLVNDMAIHTVEAPAAGLTHAERLDRLAQMSVQIGLGGIDGRQLIITAPLEAVPLARRITAYAYRAGASLVTTLFGDDDATLMRFRCARDDSFDVAPAWLFDGMAAAFKSGAARLAIVGEDPALLAAEDPNKVTRANRARAKAYMPVLELIAGFDTNWTIISAATPAWAKAVFPNEPIDVAMARLWDAIFSICRIDTPDPLVAWRAHDDELHARAKLLNQRRYASLRFRGPGTDLVVGLADGHEWTGGSEVAKNGIVCSPNIPTEEVFTTPHRDRVNGFVTSTKPLSYQGTLIEDIWTRFEAGRIVEAKARKGEEVLHTILQTDEGANHLGEVALVPFSSAVSRSGLLFYNTLFDENAASHIAIGQAYKCFVGGAQMSEQELAGRGANRSAIHVDWMIGSQQVDVDGVAEDGRSAPLMRRGEWVS